MQIHAARKYVSPRSRPLTPEEQETRWISYALKDWAEPAFIFALHPAADEMAALIEGPCALIPIPSSTGSTEANRRLANQIALRTPQARVVDCLRRAQPVESSCARHKAKRGPLPVDQHHMKRDPSKWLDTVRTYFVDNTTTSGNTLRAAKQAIGFGDALVFSDAANTYTTQETKQ
jgi:hypothetical protein